MSDTVIRINGVNVEGVEPSSVKLTINNVDPFLIGERTNSYSATVNVPRTPSNDALFKAERWPNLYTKDDVYKATVYFSGLPSPFVTGQFVAQVKAEKTQYTISLVQNTVNPANLSLPVSTVSALGEEYDPKTGSKDPTKIVHTIAGTYRSACDFRGSFTYPPLRAGYQDTDVLLGFDTEIREVQDLEMEQTWSECAYMGACNTIDGGYYPSTYFRTSNPFVDSAMGRYNQASTDITASVDVGSYVLMDYDVPAVMLRAFQLTTDEMNILFSRAGTHPSGATIFELKVKQNFNYSVPAGGTKFLSFYFHSPALTPPSNTDNYKPSPKVPVEDALHVALGILNIHVIGGKQTMPVDMPYGAVDLIKGACQMFGWRYNFDYTKPDIVAKQLIKGHPLTYEAKTYIDWSGKEDASTAVYSEVAGLGAEMVVKVGELSYTVAGNRGNVSRRVNAMNSSLAFKQNAYSETPRVFPLMATAGKGWAEGDYMRHPKGYSKYVADYFLPFRRSYQVTVKAKLSYFDIVAFKDDALYRFANLGGSFYLRTISNWDFSTGECTLTLISVDL